MAVTLITHIACYIAGSVRIILPTLLQSYIQNLIAEKADLTLTTQCGNTIRMALGDLHFT